jgi:hypothetical protein
VHSSDLRHTDKTDRQTAAAVTGITGCHRSFHPQGDNLERSRRLLLPNKQLAQL